MDRLTKLVVLGSTVLAFGLLVDLNSQASRELLPLAGAAFVAACLLESFAGDLVMSAVLFLLYLVPAIFLLTLGIRYRYSHASPWLAALLGCICVRSLRTGWAFPRPFKAPLVLWALSLSLVWPILVARELDFTPSLLYANVGSSRAGIPPSIGIELMQYSICTSLIGLLFLDWLFATYARADARVFERRVTWPLLAGCLVGALVAVYQSFGHISFLNPTIYGFFGRATGTMLDGNVFGTIAALWIPVTGAILLASIRRPGWHTAGWIAALAVLGVGLFATGSRAALVIPIVAAPPLMMGAWRLLKGHRTAVIGLAVAFAVLLAAVLVRTPSSPTAGLGRLRYVFGDGSAGAIRSSLAELWRRNGYGTASTEAILEHPLVGIGAGTFVTQAPDWMFRRTGFLIFTPDNAQNWFRQQLAELGLLGSAGWIAWTVCFGWAILRRSRTVTKTDAATEAKPIRGAVTGAVVGFACASLFATPAQEAAVSLTFIVFAFWCLQLVAPSDCPQQTAPADSRGAGRRWGQWMAVVAIAVAFASGTAYAAWNELRPPFRALAADWSYQHGFFDYEELDKNVRWTGKQAVDVFPTPKAWLKLVVAGGPPDSAAPVDVEIWRNHDRILRLTSTEGTLSTTYVRVPELHRLVEGNRQVMIEIVVSRTWKPSDYGRLDRRDLGVRVDRWTFVDEPPEGAARIE